MLWLCFGTRDTWLGLEKVLVWNIRFGCHKHGRNVSLHIIWFHANKCWNVCRWLGSLPAQLWCNQPSPDTKLRLNARVTPSWEKCWYVTRDALESKRIRGLHKRKLPTFYLGAWAGKLWRHAGGERPSKKTSLYLASLMYSVLIFCWFRQTSDNFDLQIFTFLNLFDSQRTWTVFFFFNVSEFYSLQRLPNI